MSSTTKRKPRWQRIAWALGADDLAVDAPVAEDQSEEAIEFRDWAERTHGSDARRLITAHLAIEEELDDGR